MSDPHWLIQELVGEAIWATLGLGIALAWKYRDEIANKVRRRPVLISAQGSGSGSATVTLTVGKSVEARWNVLRTVGKSIEATWNVEAPIPPLAKRLTDEGLEMLSWYLRHA